MKYIPYVFVYLNVRKLIQKVVLFLDIIYVLLHY